jgi:hypothetical protein
MSEKLSWFKFDPSNWMMGRIRKMDKSIQSDFLALICVYWNNECELSIEDAELEVGESVLNQLIKYKIVKKRDESIAIDFLDDQLVEICNTSEKRSIAAKKRWHAKDMQVHSNSNASALQTDADKIREDKIRTYKSREEGELTGVALTLHQKKVREDEFRTNAESLVSIETPKEEVKKFCDYWTESKPKGRKMKFEMEKTFDLKRRLAKWLDNAEKWNKDQGDKDSFENSEMYRLSKI